MSFTETISSSPVQTTVLLSPSKRRRITTPAPEPEEHQKQPTTAEIWAWTLTKDAIAPCFIKDVFEMRENGAKEADFFWLGRVPCRTVRLVGMVVGVTVYEKRILYSLDDGSSVIDCLHRLPLPPSSPKKFARNPKLAVKPDPPPPKPLASVGSLVSIIGKVTRWHDSRQIHVDSIDICPSPNSELTHWRAVLALHSSSYFPAVDTPFVIPRTPATSIPAHSRHPIDTDGRGQRQTTPAPSSLPSPITPATPSTAASSPTKSSSHRSPQSPPKLRHPSRLHTRDLTANTFRIYLKHYMDHVSVSSAMLSLSFFRSRKNDIEDPTTPTKPSKHKLRTPLQDPDWTPRPAKQENRRQEDHEPRAFTLSHLRRVPELAELARRVVRAEAKRRAREEHHKERDKPLKPQSTANSSSTSKRKDSGKLTAATGTSSETLTPKIKRLFSWAVVKLYEEGAIVLSEGPRHSTPFSADSSNSGGLWKTDTSSASADSTVFSVGVLSKSDDLEDGELSDPPDEEEAYIPLTPAFLAQHVERAIVTLTSVPTTTHQTASSGPSARSRPPAPRSPTPAELTAFLTRTDARWARVGVWAVEEALMWLSDEERIWCVGEDRWEVCL